MLHWYCKATYNLGQIFFPKRHTIWDGGSRMLNGMKYNVINANSIYFSMN